MAPRRSIAFHDPDWTVLIDGDYIIRGVAGRILFAMLSEYQRSGRTRFPNRELRLNRDIALPVLTALRALLDPAPIV